ncbi:hypothetical protein HU200_045893 [Digitaria exilis]|uniref:DUF6598 domain-containing protein n=1 Tax=Digitaria exilis TaxID=1010633 RepID=A0A835EE42_9POAL|nr:hypothetical protein HU200_045893 [Digitaria exilis]
MSVRVPAKSTQRSTNAEHALLQQRSIGLLARRHDPGHRPPPSRTRLIGRDAELESGSTPSKRKKQRRRCRRLLLRMANCTSRESGVISHRERRRRLFAHAQRWEDYGRRRESAKPRETNDEEDDQDDAVEDQNERDREVIRMDESSWMTVSQYRRRWIESGFYDGSFEDTMSDPTIIEADLKVKAATELEDECLAFLVMPVVCLSSMYSRMLSYAYTSECSTLEFKVGHIVSSVEATIFVRVMHGSWPHGCRGVFAAFATGIYDGHAFLERRVAGVGHERIVLLDSRGGRLHVDGDGDVELSRRVVSAEDAGRVIVRVEAFVEGDGEKGVEREARFESLRDGRSPPLGVPAPELRRPMAKAAASRVLLLVVACALAGGGAEQPRRSGCFTRLFSFGDSITDNGNWMSYARPPYGETFFRRPNGRFCDGRIIIDHLGERAAAAVLSDALGIPFLTSYLAGNESGDYAHGANFAVGGATALGHAYLEGRSSTPSSLFLVGEIGGNDYNQALFQGRSVDEVKTYVPDVIAGISASVTELIGLGGKTVVVPGNFPIGCNPGYLTKFQTNDTAQYDSMGCLRWPNDLVKLHNRALRAELAELGRQYPGIAVVYADYYAAAMDLTGDPRKHGFGSEPLVSCCGGGGPYNTNLTVHCGTRAATTCRDPYAAVSWDGFHYTDHAYKVIADGVLRGPHATPPVLARCDRRRRP